MPVASKNLYVDKTVVTVVQPQKQPPMQPQTPEPRKVGRTLVAVVIVALILVVALGLDLTGALSSSPPLPLAVTNAPICVADVNSTLPCGYAGSSQGLLVVTAASITKP